MLAPVLAFLFSSTLAGKSGEEEPTAGAGGVGMPGRRLPDDGPAGLLDLAPAAERLE